MEFSVSCFMDSSFSLSDLGIHFFSNKENRERNSNYASLRKDKELTCCESIKKPPARKGILKK
jgi:hypothetical protein